VGNQAALTVEPVPGVRLVNLFFLLRAVSPADEPHFAPADFVLRRRPTKFSRAFCDTASIVGRLW
jgi:hypothetical protein